ncbi:MAG: hypothetical protein ACOZBW_05780 [Thermodesulfobacteriota bacterium]
MSILFVEESYPPGIPEIQRFDAASVYIMVKRRPFSGAGRFKRALLSGFTGKVNAVSDTLDHTAFKQHHLVRGGAFAALSYMATRKHVSVSLLSRIRGLTPPAPYHISLFPYYDAVMEFQFAGQLSNEQKTTINDLAYYLANISKRVSVVESNVRYQAFDDKSPAKKNPFHLVFISQEPSSLAREQAQKHWINEHAAFVVNHVKYTKMIRYRISHSTIDKNSPYENRYGGIAFCEFKGLPAFMLNMLNPNAVRLNNSIVLDEMNLSAASRIMLMEEYDLGD